MQEADRVLVAPVGEVIDARERPSSSSIATRVHRRGLRVALNRLLALLCAGLLLGQKRSSAQR